MNEEQPGGGPHAECYACPVGLMFASVHTAQPEAVEHLMNAAQELVAAARSLLDAADRVVNEQRERRSGRPASSRVRRIDVD